MTCIEIEMIYVNEKEKYIFRYTLAIIYLFLNLIINKKRYKCELTFKDYLLNSD